MQIVTDDRSYGRRKEKRHEKHSRVIHNIMQSRRIFRHQPQLLSFFFSANFREKTPTYSPISPFSSLNNRNEDEMESGDLRREKS
uniref:Fgenesh protein 71 n=1 Tax=Beta vulgaris TaxID=161934 RepID=Q1ZY17_BETVU|nr:Fgenesh protein 71 [Beta vulgaris]